MRKLMVVILMLVTTIGVRAELMKTIESALYYKK